jgi:hypothetical protein
MPAEKKRVFVISPYPVYPIADGAARRIDGISQMLAAKGCDVFLFAPRSQKTATGAIFLDGSIRVIPYRRKRKFNYFINRDLCRVLKEHMAERPDLIILNFPYLSWMVFPLARKYKIPVHLDAHNVEHRRFKDMGRPFVAKLIYVFERYAVKNARTISVTSEIDGRTLKTKFGRESTVIENFIDTGRFFLVGDDGKDTLKKSIGMVYPKIVSYFPPNLRS